MDLYPVRGVMVGRSICLLTAAGLLRHVGVRISVVVLHTLSEQASEFPESYERYWRGFRSLWIYALALHVSGYCLKSRGWRVISLEPLTASRATA